MKIELNDELRRISSVAVKLPSKLEESEAYRLCVRADALRFANLHRESVSKYLQSIMLDRNNPDSYYGLGVSYKYLGNYDKAIDVLLKSIDLSSDKFEVFYELGVCYLLLGKPDKAIESFINAITLEPENSDTQIQLALAHEIVGEENMAMMIYDKLIETKPGYLQAYAQKASLLICQGKYFEASKIFFQIIKLNADYYKAYLGIGVCFENLNKATDAKRYYKKFLEMKPESKHFDFVASKLDKLRKKHSMSNPFELVK